MICKKAITQVRLAVFELDMVGNVEVGYKWYIDVEVKCIVIWHIFAVVANERSRQWE